MGHAFLGRRRFTLVELMIVVAIMMVLAAIAIPNFHEMQLKAKRAEVPTNVHGILDAERAYDAANDAVLTTIAFNPGGALTKNPRPWDSPSDFDTLGWRPDGDVRGSYGVATPGNGPAGVTTPCLMTPCDLQPGVAEAYCIHGVSDIDGDPPSCFQMRLSGVGVIEVQNQEY